MCTLSVRFVFLNFNLVWRGGNWHARERKYEKRCLERTLMKIAYTLKISDTHPQRQTHVHTPSVYIHTAHIYTECILCGSAVSRDRAQYKQTEIMCLNELVLVNDAPDHNH